MIVIDDAYNVKNINIGGMTVTDIAYGVDTYIAPADMILSDIIYKHIGDNILIRMYSVCDPDNGNPLYGVSLEGDLVTFIDVQKARELAIEEEKYKEDNDCGLEDYSNTMLFSNWGISNGEPYKCY